MEGKSSDWLRGPSGPTVCRCCFAEGCYKDISTEYFWMGKREVYAEMLSETLDLSIAYAQTSGPNSNTRLICEPCISRLRDASEFKRQVQECEKMFLQYLDPGREGVTDLETIPETLSLEKEVKLERVKQEEGHSDDDFDDRAAFDDEDDDDLDDQPLTRLASKVPKKESVDLLDLLDNAKVAEKRKSSTKTKTTPAKKAKTKKETPKATASKAKPEKKKKEREQGRDPVRDNAVLILRHSSAYPFQQSGLSFRCCFCPCAFDDPNLFRSHMKSDHREIDKTTSLKTQSLTRVDITDLQCNRCLNTFISLNSLAVHLNEKHQLNINTNQSFGLVPLKLEKDKFACLMCTKLFTGIKQLSRHAGTHFLRNICDSCGQNFETRRGLKDHVLFNHSSKYMCRICKTPFATVEAKKDHMRKNKRCYPFSCNICKERFRSSESRQTHLESVHDKPKITFKCTECDAVFRNRTSLYLHFKAIHTNDFKCGSCELTFDSKRSLSEHMRKTHTGERPYSCQLCDKTFRYKKGFVRHAKVHDDSKKHTCKLCQRMFVEKSRLKQHLAKHHSENKLNTS